MFIVVIVYYCTPTVRQVDIISYMINQLRCVYNTVTMNITLSLLIYARIYEFIYIP